MAKYIEQDVLITIFQKTYRNLCNNNHGCYSCEINETVDLICNAPSADVAPVLRRCCMGGGKMYEKRVCMSLI